jgi:hypothetical protein
VVGLACAEGAAVAGARTADASGAAAQRVRADQQTRPSLSREKQRRGSQHRPVARPQLESPAPLSGEQLDLVAQDDRLQLALAVNPAGQQSEEAAQEPVDQQPEHATTVSERTSAPIKRSPQQADRVSLPNTLVEAANHSHRQSSPDHGLYESTVARCGRGRGRLTVARKIARRSYHVLLAAERA